MLYLAGSTLLDELCLIRWKKDGRRNALLLFLRPHIPQICVNYMVCSFAVCLKSTDLTGVLHRSNRVLSRVCDVVRQHHCIHYVQYPIAADIGNKFAADGVLTGIGDVVPHQ